MKVTYISCDGVYTARTFKSLTSARDFAQKWVGKNPEIGRSYAISGDGVGKITAQGVELAALFGDAPAPAEGKTDTRMLSDKQLAVMASVLGVSNSGSDHLFVGPNAEVTPERVRLRSAQRSRIDIDSLTTEFVSGLCEDDSMLDMFLEEARDWVKKLQSMTVAEIKAAWPRYADFVDCVE